MEDHIRDDIHEQANLPYEFLDKLEENPYESIEYNDANYAWVPDIQSVVRRDGEKVYLIDNIQFDTLEEVFAIKKHNPDFTIGDAIEDYCYMYGQEWENKVFSIDREVVEEAWKNTTPITKEQVMEKYPPSEDDIMNDNENNRKLALSYIEGNFDAVKNNEL